jgi:exosome complex RNA-binding protein Rrp42 (RNase PH superfamily)
LNLKPAVFSGRDVGNQDHTDTVATHKYVKAVNGVCLQRLDGRQTYDYRNIRISFGTDYGCCIVELGKTR